jgi:cysteine desulfurase/selenocysteine lyase
MNLDVAAVKADFPLLGREVHGTPIVYLDSGATSQKPRAVLDAMDTYYETINANVHRGAYHIAELSTTASEDARRSVARFIGATDEHEVVFTKNATEAINLVAHSWGRTNLVEGDVVLLSLLEHHANIVPWHQLAEERGTEVRWIPLTDDGRLDLGDIDQLLEGVRLVAVTAVSNVTGAIPPVRQLADAAHAVGALCLVDASQYVPHLATDVAELGCDFLAFTGHKMCGPTGIGVLWGRRELLEAMPPVLGGGEMILDVRQDGFTPNEVPWRFEAGTPPITEMIGIGAAVDYLEGLGMDAIRKHEVSLTDYALRTLGDRFGDDLLIHGPTDTAHRGGILSMCLRDIHAHDLSQVLDQHGVCVRAGHHCAKPLMRELGVTSTSRASLYLYNDESDIDALADALADAAQFFDF